MRIIHQLKQSVARRNFIKLFSLGVGGLGFSSQLSPATTLPTPRKIKTTNIFAIGGQGLNWRDDNLLLAKYFLNATKKDNPKVCFLPTASGDSGRTVATFYEAMTQLSCRPRHLRVFSPHIDEYEPYLLDMDAIYVGGGNTLNMVAIWKQHGIDDILRKAWQQGIVLGGTSAGSICWFEQGSTDSRPGKLTAMDCLGFLAGSNCAHYDSEDHRRPTYHQMILSGDIVPGLACDDGVGLHFEGDILARVVSFRLNAKAYRVKLVNGEIVEEIIVPEFLGDESVGRRD